MVSYQMQKISFSLEYREKEFVYEVWLLKLWEWCCELMRDPSLINHFEWDARRVYAHNGGVYERRITEPWTADGWWDVQVCHLFFYSGY